MKRINGVAWYYFLTPNEKRSGLFDAHPRSSLLNKFIVCWDYFDIVHQKTNKLYSCFENYIQFVIYFLKVQPNLRTFYEIVLGEHIQKPHFDVDMELVELGVEKEVLHNLIKAIVELIPDINLQKDICIYSSHSQSKSPTGVYKISYHVIINNYSHSNNKEAKAFYYAIMQKLPKEYYDNQWIDHSVYSKTQQFRIYGCQKIGTDRTKKLCEEWEFNGEKIIHETEEKDEDPNRMFLIHLEESLVTARQSMCKQLISFQMPEQFLKKKTYDTGDLDLDLAMEALQLFAHSLGTIPESKAFPFKFDKIDSSFIILKRRKASKCRICNRIHDHENPYLIVSENKAVYFHCRRAAPDKKLYVGSLKSESPPSPDTFEKKGIPEKDNPEKGNFEKGSPDKGSPEKGNFEKGNFEKEKGSPKKEEVQTNWVEAKLAELRKIAASSANLPSKKKEIVYDSDSVNKNFLEYKLKNV